MSAYTGPITIVTFIGPRDRFVTTFHDNVDDDTQVAKVVAHWAKDGYKPDIKSIRKAEMVNGSIVHPSEKDWRPRLGYSNHSAFLRP